MRKAQIGVHVDDDSEGIFWHAELDGFVSETKRLHQKVIMPDGVEVSVTTLGEKLCITTVEVDDTQAILFIVKRESTEL